MRRRSNHLPRTGPRARATVLALVILVLAGIASSGVVTSRSMVVFAALAVGDAAPTDSLSEVIARGRRVYEGKAGGALCVACHGPQAKGVPGIGPDLTDGVWLHGDGSLASIRATIRAGVTAPKNTAAVMPPFGGSPLQPDQLEAVATYVHSLSSGGR